MEELLPYDDTNPQAIEEYSQKLIGKTFDDVLRDYFDEDIIYEEKRAYYNNPHGKGSLGNLIEKYFFLYEPNSNPEPDFPKAGVELKVTPVEQTKTGKIRAGERLVIGMIPNDKEVVEDLAVSHVLNKLELILLIVYLRIKGQNRISYEFKTSKLFSVLSEALKEDYKIIESDYNLIVSKIKSGNAHELSEGDTMYLGACTKGATAAKSLQSQFYNPDIKAKRRAFSLKQGYMTHVFNKYFMGNITTYDSIVEDDNVTVAEFENIVIARIEKHIGKSKTELCQEFGVENNNSKSLYSTLAFRMLGISSNNAEEFVKSDTIVKAIRIETNGSIRESMSIPTMNFIEFSQEEWEDSIVYDYFSSKRFLFVIYENDGQEYILKDATFWNMSETDLEGDGYLEWKANQNIINQGVKFEIGKTIKNDLPKAKDARIFHLRPHAKKSAYLIDGDEYGKGLLERDADVLPNGDMMTKQSFWLNKSYVLEQLKLLEKI